MSMRTGKVGRAEERHFPPYGREKSVPNKEGELPGWRESPDQDPRPPSTEIYLLDPVKSK